MILFKTAQFSDVYLKLFISIMLTMWETSTVLKGIYFRFKKLQIGYSGTPRVYRDWVDKEG